MKEIKTPAQIKKDLAEILNIAVNSSLVGTFTGTAQIDEQSSFVLSSKVGYRPVDVLKNLTNYVTAIALQPQLERTWQSLNEYQLSKTLQRGDIVRRKDGRHAFLVSNLYGTYAIVVDTTDIEDLSEWQLQIDAAHQDFQDIKISPKLIEVGNVLKHKLTTLIYTVTHVSVEHENIVHIAATRTEELNKRNIEEWEVSRGYVIPWPSREMKIAAIFKGTNSLGYVHNSLYDLKINSHANDSTVNIVRQDGSGGCVYGSIVAFLENWDLVRGK